MAETDCDALESQVLDLVERFTALDVVVVAFSGGVDSSLVAALAARALGKRAVAVTAVSPALASGELDAAARVAAAIGIRHRVIATQELDREGYRRNDRFRCYHCKSELYDRLAALARGSDGAVVVSGANTDDLGDWRPGLQAAAEHGVRHPLVEAGVGKVGVRALARLLHVPSAEKPASPCLASRLPYGTRVTPDALGQVDRAESALRARGYRDLRVRHFGTVGRVQLAAAELRRLTTPGERLEVVTAVQGAGFAEVVIDSDPLRSGSMNLPLVPAPPPT